MKAITFKGNAFEYFKIWIVNILLTIITLGIYYPWAKVRNNKYFYSNSFFDENNFDYHATGKQLFIGYLIGVVLFIAYTIINKFFPTIGLVLFVLLFISIPWLIYRSMRFNMNITSFSNVRFSFDGELKDSYIIYFAYPLLFLLLLASLIFCTTFFDNIIVVIGTIITTLILYIFAFAFFSMKSSTYLLNHSKFGQGQFSTNLKVSKFITIMLKTFGITLLSFIVCAAICIGVFYLFLDSSNIINQLMAGVNDPSHITAIMLSILPFFFFSYFLLILINFTAIAYYIVKQREYIFENSKLDEEIQFESKLKFTRLVFIMATNMIAIILTLGLAIPWAKIRYTRYMLSNTYIKADNPKEYISTTQKQSAIGEEIGDVFDVDVAAF